MNRKVLQVLAGLSFSICAFNVNAQEPIQSAHPEYDLLAQELYKIYEESGEGFLDESLREEDINRFSNTLACTYEVEFCASCQSTGKYAGGTMPKRDPNDDTRTSHAYSFGTWHEDRNGNILDRDTDGDGVVENGKAVKAGAALKMLRKFGIDNTDVCTGSCPAEDEACFPDGIINGSGDGVEFKKWCVPWDGPINATEWYCSYHAVIVDANRTPKFKASTCSCYKVAR
ncbi:MAG: hypothetical protein KDD70_02155 [Bdellovibrionales bacterium]|nr:hypothetical protein [Bdellovibrionales bacterium]